MEDLWENAPDVTWTCAVYRGTAILAIQSTWEPTGADWLSRDLERVSIRYLYDNDKFPEMVPHKFICFEGIDYMNPILATDLHPALRMLDAATIAKRPWWLILQMTIEGEPHMKLIVVNPDGTTSPGADPLGRYEPGEVWPTWFVGMV